MGHAVEKLPADPVDHVPDGMGVGPQQSEQKSQILVLEDNELDQKLIERTGLKTGLPLETKHCSDMAEFKDALDVQTYNLVLIDYLLGDHNGLEAQELLKRHSVNAATPVVMMSNSMHPNLAVKAIKNGSMDCVEKRGLDAERFKELILGSVRLFAEFSRTALMVAFEHQRREILNDVTNLIRKEIDHVNFSNLIESSVTKTLDRHNLGDANLDGVVQFAKHSRPSFKIP